MHITGCVSCIGFSVRLHIILPFGTWASKGKGVVIAGFVKLLLTCCERRRIGISRFYIGAEVGESSVWVIQLGNGAHSSVSND